MGMQSVDVSRFEVNSVSRELSQSVRTYWQRLSASGWEPMHFCRRHKSLLALVLDSTCLEVALDADTSGEWGVAASSVSALVSSGALGKYPL